MLTIYITLLTLLLYFLFGTIVDLVMNTHKSTQHLRIRVKVFFHTYIAPLMFALVITFFLLPDRSAFKYLMGGAILLGSLVRIFSIKRMYITKMEVEPNLLKVNYLTTFLKPGSKYFNLADISCMELENANWLMDSPAIINVKHKTEWEKFEIIDRTLKAIIRDKVDVANKGLVELKPL